MDSRVEAMHTVRPLLAGSPAALQRSMEKSWWGEERGQDRSGRAHVTGAGQGLPSSLGSERLLC